MLKKKKKTVGYETPSKIVFHLLLLFTYINILIYCTEKH